MQISTPEVAVEPKSRVTVTLPVPPELLPWKPENISIPNASPFVVEAIRVGGVDQFRPGANVPAHVFADADVRLDVVTAHRPLTLVVVNTSARPQTFRCDVMGRSAK